ncbi:hypothetical protein BBJ28_00016361 [Nothophytophthora sp. Chile5]|nr:hypothetical protein BBJ28_00016361 [Nothophytophthora sp. Chile5]
MSPTAHATHPIKAKRKMPPRSASPPPPQPRVTTQARSIATLDGYVSRGHAPPASVPRDHAMLQDFAAYLEHRLKSQNLALLRRIFADFLNEHELTIIHFMQQAAAIITVFPVERSSRSHQRQAAFLMAKPKYPVDTRGCVFVYLQYRTATRSMNLLKDMFLDFQCRRELALQAFVARGAEVISVIPFELRQTAPMAAIPPSYVPPTPVQSPEQAVASSVEPAAVRKRRRKRVNVAGTHGHVPASQQQAGTASTEPEVVRKRRKKRANAVDQQPVTPPTESEVASTRRKTHTTAVGTQPEPPTAVEPSTASSPASQVAPRPTRGVKSTRSSPKSPAKSTKKQLKPSKLREEVHRQQLELVRKLQPFEAMNPWDAVFADLPMPFDEERYPALARQLHVFWRTHARAVWERNFWRPVSRDRNAFEHNLRNNRQLKAKSAFERVTVAAYQALGAPFFVKLDSETPNHPGWWFRGPIVSLFALQQLQGEDACWRYVKHQLTDRHPDCSLPLPLESMNSAAIRNYHVSPSRSMWATTHQMVPRILREIAVLKAEQEQLEEAKASEPEPEPANAVASDGSQESKEASAAMPSSCEDEEVDRRDLLDDEEADSSSLSSYDSEEFGAVARKGFTRMYVLSRGSRPSPDSSEAKDSSNGPDDWHLLYASGQHYFHGTIELPEDIHVLEEADGKEPRSFFESIAKQHEGGVELADVPRLLPLLHSQQDALQAVDDVTELPSGLQDVVSQMQEVGEFLVEELAKPRTIERLTQGAKELPWLADAAETTSQSTFFELQTYPNTNDTLVSAGTRLVVMKLVLRGVLLDIVYSRDSYFVTLRENTEEIALEDTFVPNGTSFEKTGVYLLDEIVKLTPVHLCCCGIHYSGEDLKQLLLWCTLPTSTLTDKRSSSSPKPTRLGLAANDTQLYCLLAKRGHGRNASQSTQKAKKKATVGDSKRLAGSEADDEDPELVDAAVVFQFNQFVYHGSAQLPAGLLDDPEALSARGLPLLRAQASDLAFAGTGEELLGSNSEAEAEFPRTKFLSRFAEIHRRFQSDVGSTLLALLLEAQRWVVDFLKELPTASGGDAQVMTHLARWLEVEDGSEAFFELELAAGSPCPFGNDAGQSLDLLVWKGLVNDALLGVVYRRGSFFMTLRPIAESSDVVGDGELDDDASSQLFSGVPPRLDKGRGYLVRRLTRSDGTPTWLEGAKLLLWQTSASLEREEAIESQLKARESKTPCLDWFEDPSSDVKAQEAPDKPHVLRPVEAAEGKGVRTNEPSQLKSDKVARPHHVPRLDPLLSAQAKALSSPQPVPWDLRTGRPL